MSQIKAELLDYMGDDLAVVNAARVSFDKSSDWEDSCDGMCFVCDCQGPKLKDSDVKLINYLAEHNHWTPFSHTALKFRVAAPVPIRTQCFKHKVGLTENEESRRYISSTPEIFIPEFFRSKPEGSIKQGSGTEHYRSDWWKTQYLEVVKEAVLTYEEMLADGVAPEQCRFILPQGAIVNWIWTGNLVSFANFYVKRTDKNAQKEIQDLAKLIGKQIERLFPVSWKALVGEK